MYSTVYWVDYCVVMLTVLRCQMLYDIMVHYHVVPVSSILCKFLKHNFEIICLFLTLTVLFFKNYFETKLLYWISLVLVSSCLKRFWKLFFENFCFSKIILKQKTWKNITRFSEIGFLKHNFEMIIILVLKYILKQNSLCFVALSTTQ